MNQIAYLDLDGVLLETFQLHVAGWKYVLRYFGKNPDIMYLNTLSSIPTVVAMRLVFERHGIPLDEERLMLATKLKSEHRDGAIELLSPNILDPDILTWLKDARQQGYEIIVIATSTATDVVLKQVGLSPLITAAIYGADIVPSKRESAAVLLRDVRARGARVKDAFYVDDCREAVLLAAAAGMPSVHIGTAGRGTHAYFVAEYLSKFSAAELHKNALDRLLGAEPEGG